MADTITVDPGDIAVQELALTVRKDRTIMWGRVGKLLNEELGENVTASEALSLAGLDWDVERRPVAQLIDDKYVPIPNRFSMVRADTGESLGVLSNRYNVLQNRDAFAFLDKLTDSGHIHGAWDLRGGREVGIAFKLNSTVGFAGGLDEVQPYILFRNRHDGSGAVQMVINCVQIYCLNQMSYATGRGAKARWSMPHSMDIAGQIKDASQALNLYSNYITDYKAEMDLLVEAIVPDEQVYSLLNDSLVTLDPNLQEKSRERVIHHITQIYEESETMVDEVRGTAYGLEHAITEYCDHGRSYRTPQAAFNSNTDSAGFGHRFRSIVHGRLLALAA